MDFLKKHHHRHHSSATSHRSISDSDSQLDDFHSPLRADSPLRSDDLSSTSTAIIPIPKSHSPFRSPLSKPSPTLNVPSPPLTYNHSPNNDAGTDNKSSGAVDNGTRRGDGGIKTKSSAVNRSRSGLTIGRLALGFRVCEMILSLIAISVMASDRTKGWSGDSFDRYKEYRYLVGVNAIAFSYAAFQAIDHTYFLVYGTHIIAYSLRCHFDFVIDQVLAYLLISSSSSAATRVEDWVLNWGEDEFTKMATVSVVMSFLAFLAFAISSIISGYNLCDRKI